MKLTHIIILVLTILVSAPVYSHTNELSDTKISHASKRSTPKGIIITAYDNHIKVENAPVGSVLEIYSVVGIKVKEIKIKQSTAEYTVDIAKGYYIIRIDDTVRKITIK